MTTLDAQRFQNQLDTFYEGCDQAEKDGLWDTENNGQMEVYYENDVLCFLMKISAADSSISADETSMLNELLGMDYSPAQLRETYENSRDIIESDDYADQFKEGLDLLESVSPALLAQYKELLSLACRLVMTSDSVETREENEELGRILSLLK